ncbi:NAD(P)H-quinone oxidoreductase [Rhizomonospora bruguierae]|uniref:NAD(P)H-quinone oxidoreductase n=1 Tax=Rhizomonospora bruguierae TaxID=1581705 RepID=UPI001BCF5DE0|nr:NAD(P)H-quinone oxidoreductase [Micromonospora sp. NBRC 107566]
MYAITIPRPGGPEALVWAEVPDPRPGDGEILIDVSASAVNRADILQRQGHYDPPPGAPMYPGLEVSGHVDGEPVCALLAGGGYAEKVAVARGLVLPVPEGVDPIDAAGLPEVACTVWSNLVWVAGLGEGETVLVHGGGSGIGTFAIQFARALGARVIVTARRAKHERLRDLGAEVTVDYTEQDFVAAVCAATGGRGADVILDIMGGSYLGRNVDALAPDGRLVVIGMQGGRKAELNLGALLGKRGRVAATALRSRPLAQKVEIVRGVREQVWPLIARGAIRPVIDRRLPMAEAAQAHRLVEASDHVGKVLLVAPSATGNAR